LAHIGYKPRGRPTQGAIPKVNKVSAEKPEKKKEKKPKVAQVQVDAQQPKPPAGKSPEAKKDGGQPAHNGARPKNRYDKGKRQDNKGKGDKKFFFVHPWPENKNYLSKNGNTLTKECEDHFKGFCFRCGHSSHSHENCRIYKSKDIFITLCTRCRQGFHDSCRSRRYGLQEEIMSKKLEEMTHLCQQLALGHGTAGQPAIQMAQDSSDSD
jgi:hypothetical protein